MAWVCSPPKSSVKLMWWGLEKERAETSGKQGTARQSGGNGRLLISFLFVLKKALVFESFFIALAINHTKGFVRERGGAVMHMVNELMKNFV